MKIFNSTSIKLTVASIKMFFRDKRAIFYSLFGPIVIMAIFGFVDFSRFSLDIGIVVPEEHKLEFAGIVEGLKSNSAFRVTEGTYDDEKAALVDDKRELVLVFDKTENGELKVDALLNDTSQTQSSAISKEIKDSMESQLLQQANVHIPLNFTQEVVNVNNLSQLNYILPGVIGISLMNGSMFGVAGTIVRSREKKVLKSLFSTPLKKSQFLFAQVVTRIIVSVFQISILFLIPLLVNRVSAIIQDVPVEDAPFYFRVVGSWFNLGLFAFLGAIIFINIGFTISAYAKTFDQAVAMVNIIATPMMFFSGAFFPTETLPKLIQKIASFLPLTFANDAIRGVMNKGMGIGELTVPLLGMCVWVILMFLLAVRSFKWED